MRTVLHDARVVLQRQDYTAINRGDMFVPAGFVPSEMNRIGAALTPSILGGTRAAAIPVTYVRPKVSARPRIVGMPTPSGKVNPV